MNAKNNIIRSYTRINLTKFTTFKNIKDYDNLCGWCCLATSCFEGCRLPSPHAFGQCCFSMSFFVWCSSLVWCCFLLPPPYGWCCFSSSLITGGIAFHWRTSTTQRRDGGNSVWADHTEIASSSEVLPPVEELGIPQFLSHRHRTWMTRAVVDDAVKPSVRGVL